MFIKVTHRYSSPSAVLLTECLTVCDLHDLLFQGGGFYLLGVQFAGVVALTVWTAVMSYILLKCVDLTIGLRVPLEQEILGADLVEHSVGDIRYDKKNNKVLCSLTGRNLNSEYGLTEEGHLAELSGFNETRRKRSIYKLGDSLTLAATLSEAFTRITPTPKEEPGQSNSNRNSVTSTTPQRGSLDFAFDLGKLQEQKANKNRHISDLWKKATNKAVLRITKDNRLNTDTQFTASIRRRHSETPQPRQIPSIQINGHIPVQRTQSGTDGAENRAFSPTADTRNEMFRERNNVNDINNQETGPDSNCFSTYI